MECIICFQQVRTIKFIEQAEIIIKDIEQAEIIKEVNKVSKLR